MTRGDTIHRFLHGYVAAWITILCPWVLLLEQPAVELVEWPVPAAVPLMPPSAAQDKEKS